MKSKDRQSIRFGKSRREK